MKMKWGVLAVALVTALLGLALANEAQGAVFQPNYYENVLTNGVTTVTNGQTLAVAGKPFTIRQGKGLAVMPYLVGTNASTADVVFRLEVTCDGVNWSTTGPLLLTNAMNGATAVRGYHAVPASRLDNVRAVKLVSVQNYHTASAIVSNVVVSVSNQ